MSNKFQRCLEAATDQTLVEPNWEGILECVDMIRGGEVPVKDALKVIQKRYRNPNPHISHHALLVLEACVKNCGTKFVREMASKEFMDDLKNMVISNPPEKIRDKLLELIQCWTSVFKGIAEYKIVEDTHNLLKMNGFEFPPIDEAKAMFLADSAPDWAEGDHCYRCRVEFGVFTRKHHCRACGQIFCDRCSCKQMLLPQFGIEKKVRVCESCFEKRQPVQTNKAKNEEDKSNAEAEAREKARKEAEAKEQEELQLALALSLSEAESSVLSPAPPPPQPPSVPTVIKEDQPLTGMGEDPDQSLDSMLAKYLDRDYWERKRRETEEELARATAPPPSEPSISIVPAESSQVDAEEEVAKTSEFCRPSKERNLEVVPAELNHIDQDDEVTKTFGFCRTLKERVDTMSTRMRSNQLRGRSIVNDSAIHSQFSQLAEAHGKVLERMAKLEGQRENFERLQDHLAHIGEARQAVNALREENDRQRQQLLLEEQNRRQAQLRQKLELMRHKKHEMLLKASQQYTATPFQHQQQLHTSTPYQQQQTHNAATTAYQPTNAVTSYQPPHIASPYQLPHTNPSYQPPPPTHIYQPPLQPHLLYQQHNHLASMQPMMSSTPTYPAETAVAHLPQQHYPTPIPPASSTPAYAAGMAAHLQQQQYATPIPPAMYAPHHYAFPALHLPPDAQRQHEVPKMAAEEPEDLLISFD